MSKPLGPAFVSKKELHILEVLTRNPEGLFAEDIVKMTWGHVSQWSVVWRLDDLMVLGLARVSFPQNGGTGAPRAMYQITAAGLAELGYGIDAR